MSITLSENRVPKLEELEKKLEEVFKNKTSGAATVLEAWTYLRIRTLEELKGKFTREELLGLIDLRNGTIFDPQFATHKTYLLAELEDGETFDGLSIRHGFDYTDLQKKIEKLTSAQVYFLLEEINRFWEKDSTEPEGLEKFIKKLRG